MNVLAFVAALVALESPPAARPPAAVLELERHSPAVRDGRLVADVGLETLGGMFTVLLPRGVSVPVEKTETFSTAADDQDQIEIRLFRGIDRVAKRNTPVGRFVVDGIPRSPRGAVQIDVTFSIAADATIAVAARERAGRRVGVRPFVEPGIQSFDCTSTDEMKRGDSLRARHSGGPEGATWNWYGADLLCTVAVRGGCDGSATVTLQLARKRAARAVMPLSSRDTTAREFRVPASVWEHALQRSRARVYETLPLHVSVDTRCTDSARAPARHTWSDSFTGAFSGGE